MINQLDKVIGKKLSPNEIFKNANYTRLTEPGENYGSIMWKVDVTVVSKDTNKEKILHLVAKTLPEAALFRQIFMVQTTYTNEMAFYDFCVATLQKFQTEIGVKVLNNFAKCYGTRKTLLKNSDVIDDDAVLVFENLKVKGYGNGDRTVGFDFENSKLILKDVARFHASFVALKLKRPEEFKQQVRPYCHNYEPPEADDVYNDYYKKLLKEICKAEPECLKLAPKVKLWGEVMRSEPREPFATVIHTDLWTNNTMQILEDGKVVSNKFVDFQLYTYGSPASDVFFFLWTSVQKTVLENHLDFLLKFYHDEFVKTLKEHHCDTDAFSYDRFMDELQLELEYEFPHAMTFLFILCVGKHADTVHKDIRETADNALPQFKEKLWFMVKECNKRGWIV